MRRQKWIIFAFFLMGGTLLFLSVHPFYENTLLLGAAIGIPVYFLFQWLAPLLSEFPELITIVYWGRTGRAQLGLTNAISSKVNQWTLLIAMIPIVFFIGIYRYTGTFTGWFLDFDEAQRLEVLLTAAQGLFAAACFMNLRFHGWEAWTLISLWFIQLFDPLVDPWIYANFPSVPYFFAPSLHHPYPGYLREWITAIYLILTPLVIFGTKERYAAIRGFLHVWREHFAKKRPLGVEERRGPDL